MRSPKMIFLDNQDLMLKAFPELLSAAEDALSDFKWIEATVPNSNFQATILKLQRAILIAQGFGEFE